MSSAVIGPEICPACGRVTWLVRLMSGLWLAHGSEGDGLCLGGEYVRPADAEAVRLIREREPGLMVRAHP